MINHAGGNSMRYKADRNYKEKLKNEQVISIKVIREYMKKRKLKENNMNSCYCEMLFC